MLAGSTDDIPVLVLGVASDAPLDELARQVENTVVPQLSEVDGVRQVQVSGQDITELVVTLKPAQLRKYDLSAAVVTQAVQAQAQVVPAGNSYDGARAGHPGRAVPHRAKQVAGWWIPAPDGPVQLGTLADGGGAVGGGHHDRPVRRPSRPERERAEGVRRGRRGDLPPDHRAAARHGRALGKNAAIQVVFDQAPSIEQSIEDLAVEGGLGLAFAVLIILVFLLSLRSTIIIAISIPLSLLIALIGLQLGDYSLNIFTLAAMTVAVGRVVDDSIVVIENIKRRDTGSAPLTPAAIVASVREVAGAVTASTLTTVAVFVPVAVVSGITASVRRSRRPWPRPGSVAAGLDDHRAGPGVLVPRARPSATAARADPAGHDEDHVTRLQRAYLPALHLVLRRPLISALAAVLIFAGTMASTTLLKTDFLESFADKTTLLIDQELPLGTRLSATSEAAQQVEQVLAASPGVKQYLTTVGQGGTNRVSMFVSLTGEDAYDATLAELEWAFAEMADAAGEIKVGSINTAPATTSRSP